MNVGIIISSTHCLQIFSYTLYLVTTFEWNCSMDSVGMNVILKSNIKKRMFFYHFIYFTEVYIGGKWYCSLAHCLHI